MLKPTTEAGWAARNATFKLLSGPSRLTSFQRLPNAKWLRGIDPDQALLVQIGANTHEDTSYLNEDPGPLCVRLGWHAVLIEPIPGLMRTLHKKYSGRRSQVDFVQAAVCNNTAPLCASDGIGAARSEDMYYVDLTNATGNWGSDRSDARCLGPASSHGWLGEIASMQKRTYAASPLALPPEHTTSPAVYRPLPGTQHPSSPTSV